MSPRRRARPAGGGRAGFTLIELMIAMVILSLGLFSVVHLQLVSLRSANYANERTGAYELAQAVVNDLYTRALAWNDTNPNLVAVLPDIAPNVLVAPATGASLNLATDLRTLQVFQGAVLAAGPAVNLAPLVDLRGVLNVPGAIYRIHYAAHWMRLAPTDPAGSQNLVRLTVIVSWDNKDYGDQSYSWQTWQADFLRRHMVAVTFFLRRARQV